MNDTRIDNGHEILKRHLGDQGWNSLVANKVAAEQIVFWSKAEEVKLLEKEVKPTNGLSGFFKTISNSINNSIDQAVPKFLVGLSDNRWVLTGQLEGSRQTFVLDISLYGKQIYTKETNIIVILQCVAKTEIVQFIKVDLDFNPSGSQFFGGHPGLILKDWIENTIRVEKSVINSFPIIYRKVNFENGLLCGNSENEALCWVIINNNSFVLASPSGLYDFVFDDIIFWKAGPCLDCLMVVICKGSQIIELDIGKNQDFFKSCFHKNPPEYKSLDLLNYKNDNSVNANVVNKNWVLVLENLINEFQKRAKYAFSNKPIMVAKIKTNSLFGSQNRLVLITAHGNDLVLIFGEGPILWRQRESIFLAQDLPIGKFIQTKGGEIIHVELESKDEKIWNWICEESKNKNANNIKAQTIVKIKNEFTSLENTAILNINENGFIKIELDSGEIENISSSEFSEICLEWSKMYGSIKFKEKDLNDKILKAPVETILQIWKTKARFQLAEKTKKIKLGSLYQEYQDRRIRQNLADVFGPFLICQKRLDEGISVENLRRQIENSPPGPLPNDLCEVLVQKLSLLEISRQKLSRWIDRCTLFLPHHLANQQKNWLGTVFQNYGMSENRIENEVRRTQQIVRNDLRQVQIAFGRPLQEMSLNLNAISFAFPEEVKKAGLAAVRSAAKIAEDGAMLSAFGGLGAQLLMGFGRASMGDPFAIAYLGTISLSLVGKHLEKKAKDQEQKLLIRAYGYQALEWWDLVLDSAFVAAFEFRQSLQSLGEANLQRDKKFLESLKVDDLPKAQAAMVSVLKSWLDDSVDNSFHAIIPESGIYGYQLIGQISTEIASRSSRVIDRFGSELMNSNN